MFRPGVIGLTRVLACLSLAGQPASGPAGGAGGGEEVAPDLVAYAGRLHAYKLPSSLAARTGAEGVLAAAGALADDKSPHSLTFAGRLRQLLVAAKVQLPPALADLTLPASAAGTITEEELVRLTGMGEYLIFLAWQNHQSAPEVSPALGRDLWASIADGCPSGLARLRACRFLVETVAADAEGRPADEQVTPAALANRSVSSALNYVLEGLARPDRRLDSSLGLSSALSLDLPGEALWVEALTLSGPPAEEIGRMIRSWERRLESARPAADAAGRKLLDRVLEQVKAARAQTPAMAAFLEGRKEIDRLLRDFFDAASKEDRPALNALLADRSAERYFGRFASLRQGLAQSADVKEIRYLGLRPAGAEGQVIKAQAWISGVSQRGTSRRVTVPTSLVKVGGAWRVGGR